MNPILKWPGGKRWFLPRHARLFPREFGRCIEPFLGGGSVFFHLEPECALLGDTNAELINVYQAIKWRRKQLVDLLVQHQRDHGKRFYYRLRNSVPDGVVERAARTIYLNRTCFNGIYRVNLQGDFNVPKGTRSSVLLDTDDYATAARLLRNADLRVSDFEPLIDEAKRGDLVFADPPYVVGHNNNGFVRYNEALFKWSDQVRLADALVRARDRGVKVVATNAAHSAVADLYRQRTFSIRYAERYSSIAANAKGRKQFQEIIIQANS